MQQKIEVSPKIKMIIGAAIGIPLAISVIGTFFQCFPATYGINLMVGEDGSFPLKATIIVNWLLMMLIELFLIFIIAIIKRLFFDKSSNKS